jgi:hypothetical protein
MSPLTPRMNPHALATLTALVAITAAAVAGTGRATPPPWQEQAARPRPPEMG